ncbi:membrane protein [[Actinobacillus] muris]|uniref:Membrane protein n=1 Tax=Muribacter muris TaxID=67855 RepID=A0A0J5P4M8_9PAST|nr:OmpH family outer membrane protein [Muribacter muris]KMK51383.1 membrane protein [[Actinobacillus] muris] [Muribacter muris]
MKKLFKLAAVAAALAFSANAANANDKIGFADPGYLMQNHPWMVAANEKMTQFMKESEAKFADEDKKLQDEEKALLAERKKLEDDAKKLQKEQSSVEASLKKKVEALEKEAPRLRSKEIQARQDKINAEHKAFQNKVAAIQKREAEFGKKAEAFQKKITAFQEKIAKEQQSSAGFDPNEVQKQVVEEINQTIKTVAESKGYTLVFSPAMALYAKDEKADITEDVLAALKANAKPLPEKAADAPKTEEKAEASADAKPEEAKK